MTIKEIEEMIWQSGECATLEFKRSISGSEKIARVIVAFANHKGGKILVGVDDFGTIVGTNLHQAKSRIELAAEFFCTPTIPLQYEVIRENGMKLLVVTVEESQRKPHYSINKKGQEKAYIRADDQCLAVSKKGAKALAQQYDSEAPSRKLDSKEQAILDFLKKNEYVTPKLLAVKLNISERRAKRMLYAMTKECYLHQHKDQRGEYFTKAEHY